MADKRKLQGEIERCLKKVSEGVETFEDIWQKVNNATNSNQKEKYENDLKKEIKKLQRLRDQIKTWVASNDIKDKRQLLENRKLIETQMERFKVVERETKTKAYSKEGLGLAQKVDPAQKERDDTIQWLTDSIERLTLQVDQFESEVEAVQASSKKKKLDKDKQGRVDELKTLLERHRYHIKQLETLLRMLDNSAVEVEQIKNIKDEVEYYIEASQDPDFEENEYLYDDFDMEEMGRYNHGLEDPEKNLGTIIATSPSEIGGLMSDEVFDKEKANAEQAVELSNSSSPTPNSPSTNHSKEKDDKKERSKSTDEPVKPVATRSSSLPSSSSTTTTANGSKTPSKSASISSSASNHIVATPPAGPAYAAAAAGQTSTGTAQQPRPPVTPPTAISKPQQRIPDGQLSEATANSLNHSQGSVPSSVAPTPPVNSAPGPIVSQTSTQMTIAANSVTSTKDLASLGLANMSSASTTSSTMSAPSTPGKSEPLMNGPSSLNAAEYKFSQITTNLLFLFGQDQQSSESMTSLKSMAEKAVVNAGLEEHLQTQQFSTEDSGAFSSGSAVPTTPTLSDSGRLAKISSLFSSTTTTTTDSQAPVQPPPTTEAHLQPILGVAPLGPVPLSKDNVYGLGMLEASYHHMPHPSDSEKLRKSRGLLVSVVSRQYLPRNPCPTPPYYPQHPLPHSDSLEFFTRLSTETLFFIFYYLEGTKAQYLAAKALKKQSWRFHTKYMMWFQRHEEPKTITDEYEQGTYIYFDYEKWGQRKKEGFTFEYRYLEDRDLQ
ncbi:CCR4-NOT transcription complex subunit 3-like isoform X6 [Branchiostoma floridae]|uniref:CCR4-NOT transcription complex subunit 3 n=1 Tax=Branchiostoma floridae TaxID=7739 RepID=A0A9J7M5V5_BRAFL|nr:CCR4-NOT transcription complex subunit 3-like isoform X6 [Branchiostoma floridae]